MRSQRARWASKPLQKGEGLRPPPFWRGLEADRARVYFKYRRLSSHTLHWPRQPALTRRPPGPLRHHPRCGDLIQGPEGLTKTSGATGWGRPRGNFDSFDGKENRTMSGLGGLAVTPLETCKLRTVPPPLRGHTGSCRAATPGPVPRQSLAGIMELWMFQDPRATTPCPFTRRSPAGIKKAMRTFGSGEPPAGGPEWTP